MKPEKQPNVAPDMRPVNIVLVHQYRSSDARAVKRTPNLPLGPRNGAVEVVARKLYEEKKVGTIAFFGNWNQIGKSIAHVVRDYLVKEGVPKDDIIAEPLAGTTPTEVAAYLKHQRVDVASIVTKRHKRRVERAYRKRGIKDPTIIVAEDVLKAMRPDPKAENLLPHFRRRSTLVFDAKELVLALIPESLLEKAAGNRIVAAVQRFTDK